MNKLVEGRGNIVTSIEKLKKMGAKAKKSIPEPILKRAEEDDFLGNEAGMGSKKEQSKLEL
jgi:DNA recombination protein RmuC